MQIVRCQGAVTPAAVEHLLDMVPFSGKTLYVPKEREDEVRAALAASAWAKTEITILPTDNDAALILCVYHPDFIAERRASALLVLEA